MAQLQKSNTVLPPITTKPYSSYQYPYKNHINNFINVTTAPPIPSYYKQFYNSTAFSSLPVINANTYHIGKSFSKQYNELKTLENKLQSESQLNNEQYAPLYTMQQQPKQHMQLDDNKTNTDEDDDDEEEEEEEEEDEEKLKPYTKAGRKEYKLALVKSLGEYTESIKHQIQEEQLKTKDISDVIANTVKNVRDSLFKELDNYEQKSKQQLANIKEVMLQGGNTRMPQLTNFLFNNENEFTNEYKEKDKLYEENNQYLDRMWKMLDEDAIEEQEQYKKQIKEEEERRLRQMESNLKYEENKLNNEMNTYTKHKYIDDINLDLKEKHYQECERLMPQIEKRLNEYYKQTNNHQIEHDFSLKSKFKSTVFSVLAARRILNTKYRMYNSFKITSVKYFIYNHEEMEHLILLNIYNSIKPSVLDLINNEDVNINMVAYKNIIHADVYKILQKKMTILLDELNNNFFKGLSTNTLHYLSLFISNYSYIPRDYFTLFENIRFNITSTGEFIELTKDQRKMILIFIVIIKGMIKKVLLEMWFNKRKFHSISVPCRNNIKMIASILYRGIIRQYKDKCQMVRNLDEFESPQDKEDFMKCKYIKKEFSASKKLYKKSASNKRDNSSEDDNDSVGRKGYRKGKEINVNLLKNIEEEDNDDDDDNEDEKVDSKRKSRNDRKKKNKKKKQKSESGKEDNSDNDSDEESEKEMKKLKSKKKRSNLARKEGKPPRVPRNDSEDNFFGDPRASKSKSKNESNDSKHKSRNKSKDKKTKKKSKKKLMLKTNDTNKQKDIADKSSEDTNSEINKAKTVNTDTYQIRRKISIASNKADKYLLEKYNKSFDNIVGYTQKEIATMMEIQEHLDYYGDDNDSTEVELFDSILIKEDRLADYYNFADEYEFDPINVVDQFIEKLLSIINHNFNKN